MREACSCGEAGREVRVERLKTAAWALKVAWQIDKVLLAAVFAVAVALSVLPAVSLGFYKGVIAQLSAFIATGAGSFAEVLPSLLAYGVLLALIGLSTRVNTDFIATIMDQRFTYGMQERLMEVINRFDVLELLRRNVNEDFNYVIRQSNALGKLVSGACSIGAKAVTIATLCAVAWGMSQPVFFITLAYVAVAVLVSVTFSKGTRFNYAKFRKAEVKAGYLQNMPLEANIAKEIRVYGCTESVVQSWNAAYAQRLGMELARFRATEVQTFALGASFYVFLAAVVGYLLLQVSAGAMAPADLLTVFTLCTNLFAAMGVLTRDLINFDENLFRIEQMRGLLRGARWDGEEAAEGSTCGVAPDGEAFSRSDSPGSHESATGAFGSCGTRFAKASPSGATVGVASDAGDEAKTVADVSSSEKAVEDAPAAEVVASTGEGSGNPSASEAECFVEGAASLSAVFSARSLCFSYDGQRQVLENVSFDIREGEVVALVGSNGSGKSTLVKLLIGVLSPTSGSLSFCGRPYAECSQDHLSSRIGAFFQDFYLFHHTLAENIAYGAHERIGHDDEVQAALEKGGAAHIAARLPRGTQTLVGKRIDKAGAEFSGGEKQLLATARTYMGDKRVLIFDEPASMLDPLAELGQFEAIRNRIGGNTGILISHRVGFARMADRIIMMENGRIVEDGAHEQLMVRGGTYARFFHEQAQWYEEEKGAGACR